MTKILKSWYFFYLLLMVLVSLFSKLLSNEKPLHCKIAGTDYYPAVEEWLRGSSKHKMFNTEEWRRYDIQNAIWAPVPYAFYQQDLESMLQPPFSQQSRLKHHWLGTDHLGRDVAAGLINGCTVALQIGIGSILLILLIGLFMGVLAGYYGNNQLLVNRLSAITLGILLLTVLTYAYIIAPQWSFARMGDLQKVAGILLVPAFLVLCYLYYHLCSRLSTKTIAIPIDTIVLKTIELFTTVPKLLLLIAVLAVLNRSTLTIILIIGFLGWTTVAKLVRAEVLKVKPQEYILAVQLYGLPSVKIIWKHILPNVIGPVLTYACFGTAAAITAEAGLSYLGLGLPPNEVSWGSMLSASRENIQAYWLVLLPGLFLFLTIYSLHKTASYFRTKNQPTKLKHIEAYF